MAKKRAYFCWAKLDTDEWVNLVYESEHRKGTWPHILDLRWAVKCNHIKLADTPMLDALVYLLNKRNMYEQCFDEYRVIDLR